MYLNILDNIVVDSIPYVIPEIATYFFVENKDLSRSEYDIKLTLKNNDKELFNENIKINFPDSNRTFYRVISSIQGVFFQEEGNLSFTIECDQKLLCIKKLNIVKIKVDI